MPRSPAEGAATRGPADLEVAADAPVRDRRARERTDRRSEDVGPPNGIERRRYERRSHDRRTHPRTDRRARNRRSSIGRRGTSAAGRPAPRVAPRAYGEPLAGRSTAGKVVRALILTAVAIACLLAATLSSPKDAGAAPKTVSGKAGSVSATSGTASATLSWVRTGPASYRSYEQLKLTITDTDAARSSTTRTLTGLAKTASLTKPQLQLVDVTGDAVPDAVVDLFTGGAHCCQINAIATSSATGWNKPIVRDWRDDGAKLADLGGVDALPEFQSTDSRFNDLFAAHAASRSPIRIWSMAGGRFSDVTKQFPEYVQADVTEQAQGWADAVQAGDASAVAEAGRAAAAAWVADLALLEKYDDGKAVLAAAKARGDFAGDENFPGELGHALRAYGYVSDPGVLGLSDIASVVN